MINAALFYDAYELEKVDIERIYHGHVYRFEAPAYLYTYVNQSNTAY